MNFFHTDNDLFKVQESLVGASLITLKAVITGARACEFPSNPGQLYDKSTYPLLYWLGIRYKHNAYLIDDSMLSFRRLANEFTATILINLTLAVEPSISEIAEEKRTSLGKELFMNEKQRRPSCINWGCIFDGNRLTEPISRHSAPNPEASRKIHIILQNLKHDMQGKTLLPFGSLKSVSSATSEDILCQLTRLEREDGIVRDKHITGKFLIDRMMSGGADIPEGACQVRQKWYPTGLKPRTYYAQGGSALSASTYIRAFFNELADRFEYTNRFSRVDASRIVVPDVSSPNLFVYDYTSFTSNFSEQVYFLIALSRFMDDVDVYLAGPELTLSHRKLGDLIRTYVDEVNDLPEYYWEEGFLGLRSLVLTHCQAGFLGVFGNLMTCTVPHGIVARSVVSDDSHVGIAGDDGIAIPRSQDEFFKTTLLLGDYSIEKVWTGPWIYLKRRLFISSNGVCRNVRFPQFPTIALLTAKDNKISKRFKASDVGDWSQVRYSTYSSIITYIRSLHPLVLSGIIPEDILSTITNAINGLIRFCQLNDGPTLRFELKNGKVIRRKCLHLVEIDLFASYSNFPVFSNTVIKKRRIRGVVGTEPLLQGLKSGDVHQSNSNRVSKLLEMCGYVERIVNDEDNDEMFIGVRDCDLPSYCESGPEIYQYIVKKDLHHGLLSNFLNRPLERLHKRRMNMEDFLEFSQLSRAILRTGYSGGYIDLDWAEMGLDVLDYGDEVEKGLGASIDPESSEVTSKAWIDSLLSEL